MLRDLLAASYVTAVPPVSDAGTEEMAETSSDWERLFGLDSVGLGRDWRRGSLEGAAIRLISGCEFDCAS